MKKRVEEFNKITYNNHKINVNHLNGEWYHEFKNFLIEHYNLQTQTLTTYMKVLRAVVNHAVKNKILSENPFINCKLDYVKTDTHYLTNDDIQRIINYNFRDDRTQSVADCFIFSTQTGLSHSDLRKLTADKIRRDNDGYFIDDVRQKTDEQFIIPLNKIAINILNKYEGYSEVHPEGLLLPVIYINEYNDILKRNCSSLQYPLKSH